MHYLCDDEDTYRKLKMKHVAFGMYIGYFIAFYQDHISYYFEEETIDERKFITESDIYVHEVLTSPPMNDFNGFDTINTVIMSKTMDDSDSINDAMSHYIDIRNRIKETMVLL